MVNSEWQGELIERHGRSEARWVDAALALASLTNDMDGSANESQVDQMATGTRMTVPAFRGEVATAEVCGWAADVRWDKTTATLHWRLTIPGKN